MVRRAAHQGPAAVAGDDELRAGRFLAADSALARLGAASVLGSLGQEGGVLLPAQLAVPRPAPGESGADGDDGCADNYRELRAAGGVACLQAAPLLQEPRTGSEHCDASRKSDGPAEAPPFLAAVAARHVCVDVAQELARSASAITQARSIRHIN